MWLRALSTHLLENNHLDAPVGMHGTHLQIRSTIDGIITARELLKWAETLTTVDMYVERINDEAYVFVSGVVSRTAPVYDVTVWAVVTGLLPVLAGRYPTGQHRLAPEVLKAFSEGVRT